MNSFDPPPSPGPKKNEWLSHLVIWAILALELLPFYMMVQISQKDNLMFLENPWLPAALSSWVWENYAHAFRIVFPYVANSIVVAVAATVGCLLFSLMGAYFFARYKLPFSNLLWAGFLTLMLMPAITNIVPLFVLLKQLHLLNSLYALVILGMAGGQVFCIYMLRNFIEEIPKDLFEAAEIDGASHWLQLTHIVIPMCGSILATLGILQFLSSWNDFLMPLVVLRDPELYTIGVGLIYLDGEYVKNWGEIMAAFLLSSLPMIVLFLFSMKLFVRGLSQGFLKG